MMNFFKRSLIIVTVIMSFSACDKASTSEDITPFTFTEAQLLALHNGQEKSWRLSAFYENYANQAKSELEPCLIDDTYTFFAEDRVAAVDFGDNSCYYQMPESEFGGATYTYYPASGDVFIDFSIGEEIQSTSSAAIWVLRLIELSSDRMVFANGTADSWQLAVVFEAI